MATSLSMLLVRVRRRAFSLLSGAAAGALVAGLTAPASAATRTWQPQTTFVWSNANNWAEGVAPVNGDDLVFPMSSQANIVNDIPDLHVRSIHVLGQYQVSGQPIFIGAGGFTGEYLTAGLFRLDLDVTLDTDSPWNSDGVTVHTNGQVRLNGHQLIFEGRGITQINGPITGAGTVVKNGAGDVSLNGDSTYTGQTIVNLGRLRVTHSNALGAAGIENGTFFVDSGVAPFNALEVIGAITVPEYIRFAGPGYPARGSLYVNGTPTFSGPIEMVGRQQVLCTSGAITFAGNLVVGELVIDAESHRSPPPEGCNVLLSTPALSITGLTLGYKINMKVTAPIMLASTQVLISQTSGLQVEANPVTLDSIRGDGQLTVGAESAAARLVLQGTREGVFTGPIAGQGVIAFGGAVHQTFGNATSTFTGTLEAGPGSLTLTAPLGATMTTVGFGGRFGLAGVGGVSGGLDVRFGTFLIGEAGAALVTSGPLVLENGAATILGGSLPSSLARLSVTGPVALDGTFSLALPEGFAPTVGQDFLVIQNDAADAIVGTFDGLPEGATFTTRGVTFAISYVHGTGNDVVLTVTGVVREYFLSEGATGSFFSTDILLANPNPGPAPVEITFLKSDGTTVTRNETLPALSRRTLQAGTITGLEAAAFSTIVKSTNALPLIVERTMAWDSTGYGSHTERAVDGPSHTWYFAEGAQGFFSTYVLLSNPQPTANSATVTYLRAQGASPIVRTYALAPSSRYTIDIGQDQALIDWSFGMRVVFDQPGIAERAMYFGVSPLWLAGHESAGVIAPSTSWFLAEGATGSFFETFVLLANPQNSAVTATLTFLPAASAPVVKTAYIPANGRVTINIENEDPTLSSAAVATSVSAPLPIIVERSQYWPDPASQWYEAHNSFGVTAASTRWGLAEGRVGGARNAQTYILLANPGLIPAQVSLRILRESGAPLVHNVQVEPQTRFNVAIPGDVPALTNENFGALIESSQPIVVERAMYWDANNVIWAAGSNATGTPLPVVVPH
jgi:autotransporter-associated beta strand protein